MTRAEEYLSVFNEIEQLLYRKLGESKHREFGSIVNELANVKKDRVVWQFRDDLREYSELRNAIVHQSRDIPIADPYPETIASLKKLRDILAHPKTARNIMSSPIVRFELKDNIELALNKMAANMLTNVPVYDNKALVGILSEQSLVQWLAKSYQKDGFISDATTIDDIKDYLEPINSGKFDEYKFTKPTTDIYTIADWYDTAIKNGKRLSSVFVTEKGKQDETIMGIITAWDMHRA